MNERLLIVLIGIGALFVLGLAVDMERKKEPTLQQWVNRLIEHIEEEHINEAYRRFARLVESGMEPAHAFEVVISR